MLVEKNMKADQERVKNLLTDTVTLLCKSGLSFSHHLRVEGLLGVSIDDSDVFFVHISEKLDDGEACAADAAVANLSHSEESRDSCTSNSSRTSQHQTLSHPSGDSSENRLTKVSGVKRPLNSVSVKREEEDDDLFILDDEREVVKKERRLSECMAGRAEAPRVPPLHGTTGLDGISTAFPNLQQSFNKSPYPPSVSSRNSSDGLFITERGLAVASSGSSQHSAGWVNAGLAPEMAAQLTRGESAQLSLDAVDSIAGCSAAWPAGTLPNSLLPGTPASDNVYARWLLAEGIYSSKYRPRDSSEKQFACTIEGCGKRFYQVSHMYRHQRLKHPDQVDSISGQRGASGQELTHNKKLASTRENSFSGIYDCLLPPDSHSHPSTPPQPEIIRRAFLPTTDWRLCGEGGTYHSEEGTLADQRAESSNDSHVPDAPSNARPSLSHQDSQASSPPMHLLKIEQISRVVDGDGGDSRQVSESVDCESSSQSDDAGEDELWGVDCTVPSETADGEDCGAASTLKSDVSQHHHKLTHNSDSILHSTVPAGPDPQHT